MSQVKSPDNKLDKKLDKKLENKVANRLAKFSLDTWDAKPQKVIQTKLTQALESGKLILFDKLDFKLSKAQSAIFYIDQHDVTASSEGSSSVKVACFDNQKHKLSGVKGTSEQADCLQQVLQNYSNQVSQLVKNILPEYASQIKLGDTKFSMHKVNADTTSVVRKKDQRLHIDAFISKPMKNMRLIRVYTNINPSKQPSLWCLGDEINQIIKRFARQVSRPMLFSRTLFKWLGITKKVRSLYDHYMLSMNSLMKKNQAYQQQVQCDQVEFPAGSSWMLFTDQLSYANFSGQYVLEQSVYVPISCMKQPERSPQKQLQKFYGRSIIDI